MPPRLHYLSHGYSTGYGVAGFRLVEALVDAGVELRWTPIDFDHRRPAIPAERPVHTLLDRWRSVEVRPDVVVLHAVPEILPAVLADRGSAAVVCHTVWEADELQPHWPDLLNRCDGVIVPTRWNAEVFRAGGVTVPVEVVPHVADRVDRPVDTAWLDELEGRFLVYSVAAWEGRKTPWRSIEATGRAFRGDEQVLYLLKTGARHESADPRFSGPPGREHDPTWAMAMVLRDLGGLGPPVHLVARWLTDAQVRGLHRRGDVWLSLPHAEGWDLGAFDAATWGTPVVTTGWGAPAEYLDPTAVDLVGGRLTAVHLPPDRPHPTRRWFEPDLDEAAGALQRVRADPAAAARRAGGQAAQLRARYAPTVVAAELLTALDRILGTRR